MADILTRNIVTDTGLSLHAVIFGHVCPNCKIEFETGMANVQELGGYFPVCIDGYRMWEIGYHGQYSIDPTEQVYATYGMAHVFCSRTCYKAAKHANSIARNIANSTRRRKERSDAARALRPDLICKYCQQSFKAKRIDAKYCSDKCRKNGHRSRKKESKPFLLECFRLPEDERQESPFGYYSSSFYTNGIGFDTLIEKLEGVPAIKDKVKIVKLTKYERLDRQEVYFKDSKYYYAQNDSMTRYPFLILSNDSILTAMPMAPGDNQLEYYLTQIILEKIENL